MLKLRKYIEAYQSPSSKHIGVLVSLQHRIKHKNALSRSMPEPVQHNVKLTCLNLWPIMGDKGVYKRTCA